MLKINKLLIVMLFSKFHHLPPFVNPSFHFVFLHPSNQKFCVCPLPGDDRMNGLVSALAMRASQAWVLTGITWRARSINFWYPGEEREKQSSWWICLSSPACPCKIMFCSAVALLKCMLSLMASVLLIFQVFLSWSQPYFVP